AAAPARRPLVAGAPRRARGGRAAARAGAGRARGDGRHARCGRGRGGAVPGDDAGVRGAPRANARRAPRGDGAGMSAEHASAEDEPVTRAPAVRLGPAVGLWAAAGALPIGALAACAAWFEALRGTAPPSEGVLVVLLCGALGAAAGACARL